MNDSLLPSVLLFRYMSAYDLTLHAIYNLLLNEMIFFVWVVLLHTDGGS